MTWRSRKAVDLLVDPRCVVHTTVSDTTGTRSDVKVYGRALGVDGPEERERYGVALDVAVGWRPEGEIHLSAVDATEVGYFAAVGGGHDVRTS